jgi:transposase
MRLRAAGEAHLDSDDKAQFNGLHGAKKASCALAASMLTAVYNMLKGGTGHHDLGANHVDHRSRSQPSA